MTGTLPAPLLTEVSARMLGSSSALRARVLALLDREIGVARTRLGIAGRGLEPAIVVDTVEDPRAAAANRTSRTAGAGARIRRVERTLPVVEAAIRQAVSEVKTTHYPLEPGELRLCVDSLASVTDEHTVDEIVGFLTRVGEDVVDAGGMAHVVLPDGPENDVVADLEPCFDVIVEHRGADHLFEQRWRLPAYEVDTPWMRV